MKRSCIVCCLMALISAGCTPDFQIAREEVQELSPEMAADFINKNQILDWCRWGADRLFGENKMTGKDYGEILYADATIKYRIQKLPYEKYRIEVTARGDNTDAFAFCPISSSNFGEYYATSDEYVRNLVIAFKSLGFGQGALLW